VNEPGEPSGAAPRGVDLRPLGWGWTASLAVTAVMVLLFGDVSGRSAVFGSIAWAAICVAPVVLGAVLAATSTADRQQYAARGFAVALMGPVGLALWAGTADGPQPAGATTWAVGLGSLALQSVCWAALLMWMARRTTRLEPAPGTPAVDWTLLRARLHALADGGAPMRVHEVDDSTLDVDLAVDPSGERAHRVRLSADVPMRLVQVRERLGAYGAAPLASEASFHRPGDAIVDPVRPAVQRVHGRSLQTTPLDAQALAAWPLQLDGATVHGAATHPAGWAAGDADMRGRLGVALLARVVLGSGWVWQPVLLRRPPRR
jgi:hypothetical protein